MKGSRIEVSFSKPISLRNIYIYIYRLMEKKGSKIPIRKKPKQQVRGNLCLIEPWKLRESPHLENMFFRKKGYKTIIG